ncbi:hypothetical protein XELAEV_18041986mg, partial [Xenopus laevis]
MEAISNFADNATVRYVCKERKLALHKKRKYVGNLAQLVSQYKTSLERSKYNIVPENKKEHASPENFIVDGVCPMCNLNRKEVEILGEQFAQRGQTIEALIQQLDEMRSLHLQWKSPIKRYDREIKSLITPFNPSVHMVYNLVIFEQFVTQYSLDDQTAFHLLRIWLPPYYSNTLQLRQQDRRWADKEERSNQILALPGVDIIDISFLNDIVPGENEDAFACCTIYHSIYCIITHRPDLEIGDPRMKIGHIKKDCKYRRGHNRKNREYVQKYDPSNQTNNVAPYLTSLREVSDLAGKYITHNYWPQRIPSVSIGTVSQTENSQIVQEKEVLPTRDDFELKSNNEPTELQNIIHLQDNSLPCKKSASCMQTGGNHDLNESDHTIHFPANDKPREVCVESDNSTIYTQPTSLSYVAASIKGLMLEKQKEDVHKSKVCDSNDQYDEFQSISDFSTGNAICSEKFQNVVPEPSIKTCDYINSIQVQVIDTVNVFKSLSKFLSISVFTKANCLTTICCQSNILQDLNCLTEGIGFENSFARWKTSIPHLEESPGGVGTTQTKYGIVLSPHVCNDKREFNSGPDSTVKDHNFWYIFFQNVIWVLHYIM